MGFKFKTVIYSYKAKRISKWKSDTCFYANGTTSTRP